VSINSITSGAQ